MPRETHVMLQTLLEYAGAARSKAIISDIPPSSLLSASQVLFELCGDAEL